MKIINVILTMVIAFLSLNCCQAQVKNAKTETYIVSGNCNMCKQRIETAVFKRKEAKASWNMETKVLTLKYDSVKTNASAVLKRIAEAGYDNEKFTANDTTYANLHGCCQYERKKVSK